MSNQVENNSNSSSMLGLGSIAGNAIGKVIEEYMQVSTMKRAINGLTQKYGSQMAHMIKGNILTETKETSQQMKDQAIGTAVFGGLNVLAGGATLGMEAWNASGAIPKDNLQEYNSQAKESLKTSSGTRMQSLGGEIDDSQLDLEAETKAQSDRMKELGSMKDFSKADITATTTETGESKPSDKYTIANTEDEQELQAVIDNTDKQMEAIDAKNQARTQQFGKRENAIMLTAEGLGKISQSTAGMYAAGAQSKAGAAKADAEENKSTLQTLNQNGSEQGNDAQKTADQAVQFAQLLASIEESDTYRQ